MNILDSNYLKTVEGGSIKAGIAAVLAGFGVFIIGVIDGFLRPLQTLKRKWK